MCHVNTKLTEFVMKALDELPLPLEKAPLLLLLLLGPKKMVSMVEVGGTATGGTLLFRNSSLADLPLVEAARGALEGFRAFN